MQVAFQGAIPNLQITVTDDGFENSYLLEYSGDIEGTFDFYQDNSTYFSGEIYFTTLEGTMYMSKTDLAIQEVSPTVKSIAVVWEHSLPFAFPIPIPFTMDSNVLFDDGFKLLDFPLTDGKEGMTPATNASGEVEVNSIILQILNMFNPDIPASISFEGAMELPMILYNCSNESISVEAGTFDANRIDVLAGMLGSYYYAAEPEFLAKIDVDLEVEDQLVVTIQGELKSFSR